MAQLEKPKGEEVVGTLHYDLQINPQDYLPCMIYMMKEIEKRENKLMNVFPLRTSIVPKYIKLDTISLIEHFIRKNVQKMKGDVTENKIYWNEFFHVDKSKYSKKGYKFNGTILTDGIGCSLLYIRDDLYGLTQTEIKNRVSKEENERKANPFVENKVDDLINNEKYKNFKDKVVVGIDPGKSDLIYCSTILPDNHHKINCKEKETHKKEIQNKYGNVEHFRYTQNQRRFETKSNYFKNKQEKKKNVVYRDGKTVKEIEVELSNINHKTLSFDKYMQVVKIKNKVNNTLFEFYGEEIFRKTRWKKYKLTQKSEATMVNNFKKKFGKPDDVVLIFGDWSEGKCMPYIEPTKKGIGMRSLFRRNGFENIFLAWEFRTSKKCFNCKNENEEEGINEKWLMVDNPKPDKNKNNNTDTNKRKEKVLCNGLLKCKTCNRIWNRDVNGSLNIFQIGMEALNGRERPLYLKRTKEEENKEKEKKEKEEREKKEKEEKEKEEKVKKEREERKEREKRERKREREIQTKKREKNKISHSKKECAKQAIIAFTV